jgi:hypothetical protein
VAEDGKQPDGGNAEPVATTASSIIGFLKNHQSSCPECGLQLGGCRCMECPGCGWRFDLEVLKSREPTVANIVSQWDTFCPGCRYNLKGTPGDACPECGLTLSPDTVVLQEDVAPRRPRSTSIAILAGVGVFCVTAIVTGAASPSAVWIPCLAAPLAGFAVSLVLLRVWRRKTPRKVVRSDQLKPARDFTGRRDASNDYLG